LSILRAKSMCILVTSGGRMAAPGPHLSFMICNESVSILFNALSCFSLFGWKRSATYALRNKS
jgi:hypothetical protein